MVRVTQINFTLFYALGRDEQLRIWSSFPESKLMQKLDLLRPTKDLVLPPNAVVCIQSNARLLIIRRKIHEKKKC